MKIQLGLTFLAAGVITLAAASACDTTDAARTTSPSMSPTTPDTEPSTRSASDEAASSASRTLRHFFAEVDRLGQDPASSLTGLEKVATGTQLTAERRLLEAQHARDERQVGDTSVSHLTVQSMNLDRSDPSAGQVPTAVIEACWDVSRVDVVDRHGKSIVASDRADTGWTRYTLTNDQYASDPVGGWRVASGQDLKQKSCTA